jgi:hypothetical protein
MFFFRVLQWHHRCSSFIQGCCIDCVDYIALDMNRRLTIGEMLWEEVAVTCCKLLASHLPGVADTNRENPLAVIRCEPRSVESVPVFRDPEHGTACATAHVSFFPQHSYSALSYGPVINRPNAAEVLLLPC